MSTILLIRLILVLVAGILVSCKSELQTWPNCSLGNEFIAEYVEGEGFDTAEKALSAHTETQPLPGTTVLAKEDEESVTWNIFDGERWLGEITAVKTPTGLWTVSHAAWCMDEYS